MKDNTLLNFSYREDRDYDCEFHLLIGHLREIHFLYAVNHFEIAIKYIWN